MLYVDALTRRLQPRGRAAESAAATRARGCSTSRRLRERLLALDPDPGVDLQNPVRMIRAIEILEAAGPPLRRLRTRTPPPGQSCASV